MWELIAILSAIEQLDQALEDDRKPLYLSDVVKLWAEGRRGRDLQDQIGLKIDLFVRERRRIREAGESETEIQGKIDAAYKEMSDLTRESVKNYAEGDRLLAAEFSKLERLLETYGLPSY